MRKKVTFKAFVAKVKKVRDEYRRANRGPVAWGLFADTFGWHQAKTRLSAHELQAFETVWREFDRLEAEYRQESTQ
jgi:hypothetical protein